MARRRSIVVLLSTLLVMSLGSGAAAQDTGDDRRVELTFMNWFYEDDMKAAYDEFFAEYMAMDPRVTAVVPEVHPFAQYHDVLNVKMAGDNPPDIAWIDLSVARAFVESGRLVNLRPILEEIPGFDLGDFNEASLVAWSIGDELYALPFTNATNSVFYNADIFREAGLPTPEEMVTDGTWTWENVKEVSKQLVDSGAARFGFHLGNDIFVNGWNQLVEVWAPYGAQPWSDDGKTCLMGSPEAAEATQLIHDMIFVDMSHPGPGVDASFFTGDIGMSLTRPDFAFLLRDADFEWGIVSQPDGPMGYVPSLAQNGIAAFDGPNADLAARALAQTLTKENSIKFQVITPSNRKSLQTPEVLANSIPDLTPEQIENTVVKAMNAENSVLEYSHPNFGPVFTTAQRIFDGEMWVPDADVPAVLTKVCDAIAGELD